MPRSTELSTRKWWCGCSPQVLEVGGSRDAMESLKAFLGREPVFEPFLKSKGLVAT